LRRQPIVAGEIAGADAFLTAAGDLRTLPLHWPSDEARMGGLDGFFAARLQSPA
jgi:16S rRNA (cytosine967-C5)-methyltransferase